MKTKITTKITIITPTPPDISAFGVRSLSSYMRKNGFDTRLIFLPGSISKLKDDSDFVYHYSEDIIKQVVKLSEGSDLIGVSFMSNYFDRAIQLTQALKSNLDIPVIWGGIHPSTSPDESLKYADIVCIGEGEEALLELATRIKNKEDYSDIEGLWVKRQDRVVKNKLRKGFVDLDSLPYFDFSLVDHYVIDQEKNTIIPLNMEVFKKVLPRVPHPDGRLKIAFRTMTDRGCPHKCSYCNVSNQKEMYEEMGSKYFRARSVENFIKELEEIKNKFPFVEAIQFFDDTFFARPVHELETFSRLYRERIKLPFYCQASPNTISDKKMEYLVNAGLAYVEMGVQTGSKRIKELYNRTESNEKIIEAASIISKHVPKIIPPDYHVIIDNPWETKEDTMETVRLLLKLPKPYGLCISSLVFFPQTALYRKAKNEGLIKDDVSDVYRRPFYITPTSTYPNFLIYLLTFKHFPKFIIKYLAKESVFEKLSEKDLIFWYKAGYKIGESLRFMAKGLTVLYHHDWNRIRMYFEKRRMLDPIADGRKS